MVHLAEKTIPKFRISLRRLCARAEEADPRLLVAIGGNTLPAASQIAVGDPIG
jgi:hypothetical protein